MRNVQGDLYNSRTRLHRGHPLLRMEVTLTVADDEASFLALERDWRDLERETGDASPYLAWAWLMAWWQNVGSACARTGGIGKPYIVVLREGPLPIAIFPFFYVCPRLAPFFLRRLRPMGYNGDTEPNGLTEEPLHLIRPGYETEAIDLLLAHLDIATRERRWDCFQFARWSESSKDEVGDLKGRFSSSVVWSKVKRGINIAPLAATWPEFRKSLSKSMRDNLPYYPKLLVRAGHSWVVRIESDPVSIETATKELIRLHRVRAWSDVGNGHEDYFDGPAQRGLMVDGLNAMAKQGAAFVAILDVDGHSIAAQAFLVRGETLLLLYSGFDPSWAKFSPLLVLQSEVFRYAMDKGMRRLDLLTGDAPWQMRWNAQPFGTVTRAVGVRRGILPFLRAAIYAVRREIAAELRRSGRKRARQRRAYQAEAAANGDDQLRSVPTEQATQ